MTAYELADELLRDNTQLTVKAAYMLRQQADRIAELEKQLQESALDYISVCSQADEHYARVKELEKDLSLKTRDRDVFRDFTLAYEKRIEELEKLEQDFIRVIKQTNPNKPQTKPLSDEEIIKIRVLAKPKSTVNWEDTLVFARAIEERHGIK